MNHDKSNALRSKAYQITVSYAQRTGHYNLQNHRPCEDVLYMWEADNFLFYGLADGQRGAKCGVTGGRACLETISAYIRTIGISNIIHAQFPDELPCTLVKEIRKQLLFMAHSQNTPYREFASTLLAVAIDSVSGEYVLLHLGDGYAVSISRAGTSDIVSAPENGITAHHTWLTTSDNAAFHLRITFGSIESKKRLLLMSDGATCFCRSNHMSKRIGDFLRMGTQEEILKHLTSCNSSDDASCIILDFSINENPRENLCVP